MATLAAVAVALAWPSPATSEVAPRVTAPTAQLVAAARAVVGRGVVVLVQLGPDGTLRQVTLFARVEAPGQTVYELLADPEALPSMQPAIRDVDVRTRRGNALTYRWTYGDVIARIHGTSAMALAPPGAVQVVTVNDGFGPGEQLWRLFPDGPSRTVAALTLNIDVTRASNPLLRWLSNRSPDFRQAWNLGYGVMAVQGLQRAAAARAGGAAQVPMSGEAAAGPLRPLTDQELASLAPLLAVGRVAVVQADGGGRVAQALVAQRVAAPPTKVQEVLDRPAEWGRAIKAIDVSNVREMPGGHGFQVAFSFPAFSVSTDLVLTTRPDGCDLQSPSGRLQRSLMTFRHVPDGTGSVLAAAARIRLRQGGMILRRMIDDDPSFGHALNAAVVLVMSRSIAERAEGRR